jgi:hypothetical protein
MGRMNHPVLTSIAAIDAALEEVAGVDPIYMGTAEKQQALVGMSRLRSGLEALQLRVLAAADDVAALTGARSSADWLAGATRDAAGTSAARRRWRPGCRRGGPRPRTCSPPGS